MVPAAPELALYTRLVFIFNNVGGTRMSLCVRAHGCRSLQSPDEGAGFPEADVRG